MRSVLHESNFLPAPEPVGRPSVWSLLPDDLVRLGHSGSGEQLFSRIQRISTWSSEGPSVGRSGRAVLEGCDVRLPRIVERHPSEDGSTRVVMETFDGHRIEAVHMPRAVKNPRVTFCVSSQIGCAMGCTFCATGTMGIVRNLSAGEIVGQVLALMRALGPDKGHGLNLVFMGMGEPLHNFDHVARAIEVLCHPMGVGMSANRITVSTSGLVPGIERLAKLSVRPLLALSLNATTDEKRSSIMPVNRAFGLERLKQALEAYPLRHGEKMLIEYVLLEGVNDTLEDAERLAAFVRGVRHNVNLIPLNEHASTSFRAPKSEWVLRFAKRVTHLGCFCTVRANRGRDVRGACGQLVQVSRSRSTNL